MTAISNTKTAPTKLPNRGDIVNTKGEKLNEHTGIHRYTIGQRRGLGIAHEKPLYVVQIERAKNQIIVGEKEELDSYRIHRKRRKLGCVR